MPEAAPVVPPAAPAPVVVPPLTPSASQILDATKPAVVPPAAGAKVDPVVAPVVAPKPVDADPRNAAFVQRETQLQKARDEHKAQVERDRAALEADRAKLAAHQGLIDAVGKKDALALLTAGGLTVAQANEAYLAQQGAPVTAKQLEEFKAELARSEAAKTTAAATAQQAARDAADSAAIKAHQEKSLAFVEANPDAYRLTREFNAGSLVHQVIVKDLEDRATKDADGNIVQYPATPLSFKEAADRVEQFYAGKIAAIRKAESDAEAAKVAAAAPVLPPKTAPTPPAKTPTLSAPSITGDLSGSASGGGPKTYANDDERMAAAIAAGNAARKK